jgi:hypothetical protein
MTYKCLRCRKKGELRKGTKTGKNKSKYIDLEIGMKESKVLNLRKTSGQRNLCLSCLEELSVWLNLPVDSN